jgi:hypothetical protein
MNDPNSAPRTYDESCVLLDRIVGRCVRDRDFASMVLNDPRAALREYGLSGHELDDFLALQQGYADEAAQVWEAIRKKLIMLQSEPKRYGRL